MISGCMKEERVISGCKMRGKDGEYQGVRREVRMEYIRVYDVR